MKNKLEALLLVDNLIQIASLADEEHKKKAIEEGKAAKAIGESMMLYHLKFLRDLIKEEDHNG